MVVAALSNLSFCTLQEIFGQNKICLVLTELWNIPFRLGQDNKWWGKNVRNVLLGIIKPAPLLHKIPDLQLRDDALGKILEA